VTDGVCAAACQGVFDLLHFNRKGLPVKWDAAQGFYVPGLKTVACSGVKSMIDVLQTGAHNRRVGSHELNMESSRSHAMITIHCNATPTDPTSYDYGTVRYGKVRQTQRRSSNCVPVYCHGTRCACCWDAFCVSNTKLGQECHRPKPKQHCCDQAHAPVLWVHQGSCSPVLH
jgi:hypothetical protein